MADVCLVSLPTLGRAKSTIVPHWILWLGGYVEHKGHSVDVVDVKSNVNARYSEKEKERVFRETVEKTIASRSPLIGLSAFTEDYRDVMKLAEEIKRRSSAKVIVGGIHATVSPEDFFAHEDSPFDAAVVGDGELPLWRLIEAEREGTIPWKEINGLVFRKGTNVIRTAPQKEQPVLDDLAIHPYHKLDMNFYLQPQQFLLRSIYLSGVHIFTARGCPYDCTFCANRRRKVTFRPLESVIEELNFLKETYDIDGFYIHDDTFTIKRDRVVEFCEKLTDLNHRFVWGMEGRVNQFPDNVFRALKESGCIQIDFGVESGSQESLNRMKKGIKINETEEVFRRCRAEKIRTYANILINTPEETEEDVRKTVDLMENIKATTYGICVTTPYPGTEIYDRYVRPPLTVEEYQLYSDCKTYVSIVDPRFRMAAHSLNIEDLSAKLGRRFMIERGWQIFSLHPSYLKALLTSSRKAQYLHVFIYRLFRKLLNMARRFLPWVSKAKDI
jgi:radical SAM superfamily enzyme YgiQ (UPF0313 family)